MGQTESVPADQQHGAAYRQDADTHRDVHAGPVRYRRIVDPQVSYVNKVPAKPKQPVRPVNKESQGSLATTTQRRGPVTLNNMEERIDTFEDEQQRLQAAMDRIKAKRFETFKNDLREFEERYNPFEVLGLSNPTDDLDLIKRAYRKQSLRFHPDKGGDERKFAVVTKAYLYLTKKIEQLSVKVSTQEELRDNSRQALQDTPDVENIYIDKNNFNPSQFNEVFEKYRLEDDENGGYGEMMDNEDRTKQPDEIEVRRVFDGKFNRDVFNNVFEDDKVETRKDLIVYDEPQPLVSSGLGYYELGRGKTSDFGHCDTVAGGQYTDYKRAYTTANRLIDPQAVKTKNYKNVEDLERERSNISYDLSPEEKRKIEIKKAKEELEEEERALRLRERDCMVENMHNRLNKMMIRG